MTIENGIKQPLRFYDTIEKQNFRRSWANDAGLEDAQLVICPKNSIIPFQLRRKRSLNPVVLFDLYSFDVATNDFIFDLNLFTLIPAPTTNHLSIVQLSQVDQIIWNPKLSFTSDLPCGRHYVKLSDGVSYWYSEVFKTANFDDTKRRFISVKPNTIGIHETSAIAWTTGGNTHYLTTSKKPY